MVASTASTVGYEPATNFGISHQSFHFLWVTELFDESIRKPLLVRFFCDDDDAAALDGGDAVGKKVRTSGESPGLFLEMFVLLQVEQIVDLFQQRMAGKNRAVRAAKVPILQDGFLVGIVRHQCDLLFRIAFFMQFLYSTFAFLNGSDMCLDNIIHDDIPLLKRKESVLFLLEYKPSVQKRQQSSCEQGSV